MKTKINIPIYSGHLVIHKVKNLPSLEKKYGLNSLFGMDAVTFNMSDKIGVMTYYICFQGDPKLDVIAHESLHIANLILREAGVKPCFNNDEAQAYLLGWVVRECLKFLKQ